MESSPSLSQPKRKIDAKDHVDDLIKVLGHYDVNKDGKLDDAEADYLRNQYRRIHNEKGVFEHLSKSEREAFRAIQKRYDSNNDGEIDLSELMQLNDDIASIDTLDSNVRYVGYLARLTALWRYAAYTSDLGEAFRPVAHPYMVRATYGISWAYVLGDVAWEGYKDHRDNNPDMTRNIVQRATFQAIASMALPAFTIHSVVHVMKHHVFKNASKRLQSVGPTIAGLACIPFLPIYDHPVEHATESLFATIWPSPSGAAKKEHTD